MKKTIHEVVRRSWRIIAGMALLSGLGGGVCVAQPSLPSTISASVSSSGPVSTGDVLTVTFRMADYRGSVEVDGFNFVVRYDPAVLAFVPGSVSFGTNAGPNQNWLSQADQETTAQGLNIKTVGEATASGGVLIAALDRSANIQKRGTLAQSGFLASMQFKAVGPGISTVQTEPYANRVLYDVNWASAGAVSMGTASVSVNNPVVVSVVASNAVTSETSLAPAAFVVSRTGSTANPLEVAFRLTGSAFYGRDYTSVVVNPLIIPAGAASAALTIQPLNDSEGELPETVSFALVDDAAYDLGAAASGVITIQDNDQLIPTVSLNSPVNGTFFLTSTNISLAASASDADGTVNRVEFFSNGSNKLGERLSAPFNLTWTNAPSGAHALTAVARDNLGALSTSAPVQITINAQPTVTITIPTNGAEFQLQDVVPVVVSAVDADDYVASVDLYSGSSLAGTTQTSPYAFTLSGVPQGTNSLVARAMDNHGVRVASSPVAITVRPPTFRDHFSNAGIIVGVTNYLPVNMTNFTRETGEPQHASRNGTKSGWVKWRAPAGGPCVIDTFGSPLDTVLAVYTGSAVSNLTTIASNDDANSGTINSLVTFNAVSNTTYYVAVDSYAANQGGQVECHMSLSVTSPIIFLQPLAVMADQGASVQFFCGAAGAAPLSYQWRRNGTNIAGASSATLTLTNVQSAHEGVYSVVVSNFAGIAISDGAALSVRSALVLVSGPVMQIVDPGSNATYAVTAAGAGPFLFQWSYAGSEIVGATNVTHTHQAALHSDIGNYRVTVRSPLGAVQSSEAQLIVRPRITALEPGTGGTILLKWYGTPNTSYAVECLPSLAETNSWITLTVMTNAVVSGEFQHSLTNSSGSQFYRIRRMP